MLTFLREEMLADPPVEDTFLSESALAEHFEVSEPRFVRRCCSSSPMAWSPWCLTEVPTYLLSGRQTGELMQVREVLERIAATTAITKGIEPINPFREGVAAATSE